MKKFLTLIFTLASALSIYGQGSMRTVQTLDQLLAINPAAVGVGSSITNTVYSVLARNSSLPYNAARTFRNWRGTPYTTNIANVYPAVDGSQWVAEDRTAPIQDSTWWTYFNNSADSTAALQAAINSQPKVLALMTDATITQLLVTNAITFQGYGITFYQFTNGVATNFIQVASNTVNVRFQGITFDGRNQAARCIRVDQNTDGELLDCTFQNFQEFNVPGKITTVAFYVNGGGTAWTVDSCIFKDLTGLPDGGIATGTGFTCGIYINREFGSGSGASSVKPKRIDIVRSKFLRILPGEDSDAIRWTDSGWVFDDINVSVDHCYFEDIGKRAFKASGSGGQFVNNIITNSFDGSFQATGWVDVGNLKEQYAVVSLYGRNLLVANNRYNGGRIRHFFESTINEDTPLPARNEIYGNIFVLSTNWGLNGLSVTNVGQGTMFGGIYRSSDINVHDNYGEVVQFGVQVFSGSTNISIRDNHFVGLANTNNLVEAASTNGWGRGVRLGRYSANGYVGGAVQNAVISGNFFDNFGAAIDLSETTNTFIGMNYTNRLNRAIVINETAPDGSFWPADIQISGGNYGAITLLRQLELAYEDTDSYSSHTNRRGGLLWDRIDQAPAFWDGAKWSSLQGYTRKNQTGGATDTTHWYRVATMWDKGYTTRGSTKITIGSGGGPATSSAAFQVINNYSDAQILMEHNFAVAGIGGGSPISAVRVVRDTPNEKLHFDFQPASALNSLLGVEVQPDWTTQAGMEPTNSWQAVQFTDMGTSLSGTEVQIGYISNITSKVFAFNGDQWNWWFGPDKFGIGEGPLSRFYISNSVPTTAHAPIFTYIDGAMNQFMRDPTSGVFYASTYKQPHQVIGWGMGLANSGTNVSVSLAAGTNITITSLGNTYVINSSAASSVTYTNGVTNSAGVVSGTYLPGANVTFTTNGSSITIASTGGGSGPTNGSAVYVKGTGVTTINLIASGELDPTYSGTNLTYAIVGNSIATNKIDSTFYAWINDKQSALSFSTGTTNDNGTVKIAIAAGSNITFTTNANTVTIASAGGGGGGLGTNLFVNNTLQQPARLTNSSTVTWTINGNGDIEATSAAVSTNNPWVYYPPANNILWTFGDSITAGSSATDRTNRWATLLADRLGLSISNVAYGGAVIADINGQIMPGFTWTNTPYGDSQVWSPASITTNTVSAMLTGFNDLRYRGTNLTYLSAYVGGLQHAISYLAIPDTSKTFAQAATSSGSWSNLNWHGGSIGRQSSSVGATLTFTNLLGPVLYLAYENAGNSTNGGSFTVTIDGNTATAATVTANTGVGNRAYVDKTSYAPYTGGPYGNGQIDCIPTVLRYGGVGPGKHTVLVTVSSVATGPVRILWAAAPVVPQPKDLRGPWVYVGSPTSQETWNVLGSDQAHEMYSEVIRAMVSRLASDGLRVRLAPVDMTFDRYTMVDSDTVHPNDAGHVLITDVFYNQMSEDRTPFGVLASTQARTSGQFTELGVTSLRPSVSRFGASPAWTNSSVSLNFAETADRHLELGGNYIRTRTKAAVAQNLALGEAGVNVIVQGGSGYGLQHGSSGPVDAAGAGSPAGAISLPGGSTWRRTDAPGGFYSKTNTTTDTAGWSLLGTGSGSGAGGLGTNLIVNGTLLQPARLTNSSTVTWTVNGNGDIEAAASGSGGSATVLKLIGSSTFVYAVPLLDFSSITNTGVITNAVSNGTDGTDPLRVTFDLSGVSSTNYVITVESEATDAVWGNTWWVEDGTRGTSQVKVWIGSAGGSTIFAGDGFTQRVKIFEQAVVGGSGGGTNAVSKELRSWDALSFMPPATGTNAALWAPRGNGIPAVSFAGSSPRTASVLLKVPQGHDLSGGLQLVLDACSTTAISTSNVVMQAQYQLLSPSAATVDTSSYSGAVLITNVFPGVVGVATNLTFNCPSWVFTAGQLYQIEFKRVTDSASDTNDASAVVVFNAQANTIN